MATLRSVPPVSPAEPLPTLTRRPLGVPSPTEVLTSKPWPSGPPGFVIRAVMWLRRSLLRLADSVVPADVALFDRSTGVAHSALLGAVTRYGFAELLEEGPMTGEELAARTGLHAETIHRVLRGLATMGIFALGGDGRFSNNRLSRALVGGKLNRTKEWIQYFSSQSNMIAWLELERTLQDGNNNIERIFGMSVWDWFEKHPDEREMFAQCMMGMTTQHAPLVASMYPFGEAKVVCDVGGGRGTLLSEILIRHPHLRGVLCDAGGVLESAQVLLRQRGIESRVGLSPANFFEAVPRCADVYTLKNILHDWDDEACKKILANVRRAAEPGQKVLLIEGHLEKNDDNNLVALADLQMMLVCSNGRERSVAELNALLSATGFAPARVFRHPIMSIVEGRAV
jgi:hypothetical protein